MNNNKLKYDIKTNQSNKENTLNTLDLQLFSSVPNPYTFILESDMNCSSNISKSNILIGTYSGSSILLIEMYSESYHGHITVEKKSTIPVTINDINIYLIFDVFVNGFSDTENSEYIEFYIGIDKNASSQIDISNLKIKGSATLNGFSDLSGGNFSWGLSSFWGEECIYDLFSDTPYPYKADDTEIPFTYNIEIYE